MDSEKHDTGMLALFYIAAFVASFNEITINVAIADIMGSFGIGSVTAQWLVTGYMIVTVVIVTAIAYLSRRFTLRGLFFAGAGCFIAGSLAAMAAPSFGLLLAARLVQAVGSGVFIPTMMNVVMAVALGTLAAGVALVNVAIQMAGCIGPALYVGIFSSGGFVAALAAATAVATCGLAVAFIYSRMRKDE